MQTNVMFRKKAWRLYLKHRGMLWIIFLLFAVVNLLWYMVKTYLIGNDLPQIIYQLMTTPVMTLGLLHLLLHLTRGKEARWSMLFDFVKSPKLLPKILAVGMIWQLPSIIVNYSILFGMPTIHQLELVIFVSVVTIVAVLLYLWIMLRLFLLPYLFVTNPKESVPEMIKSSFRIMKGQVRHLIWYGITVYWWGFALFIGAFLLIPALSFANTSVSGQLIRQATMMLFVVLLNPYYSLAFAGYANNLLSLEKDAKRGKRKGYHSGRQA